MFRKYINPAIFLLSLIAGVTVVGGIIYGGILYASSAGEAQKVAKAKAAITKSLVGLVAFLLLGSFITFMSPGGVTPSATGGGSAKNCTKGAFLGFKPWFAYLPDKVLGSKGVEVQTFANDCTIDPDVVVFPNQDPTDTTGKKQIPGVLPQIILAVVDDLLRIAALVAVAFVIVGGVQYVTSQGEPAKTKQALSSIINALIGLAIAVIAAAVVSFIGGQIAK